MKHKPNCEVKLENGTLTSYHNGQPIKQTKNTTPKQDTTIEYGYEIDQNGKFERAYFTHENNTLNITPHNTYITGETSTTQPEQIAQFIIDITTKKQ